MEMIKKEYSKPEFDIIIVSTDVICNSPVTDENGWFDVDDPKWD